MVSTSARQLPSFSWTRALPEAVRAEGMPAWELDRIGPLAQALPHSFCTLPSIFALVLRLWCYATRLRVSSSFRPREAPVALGVSFEGDGVMSGEPRCAGLLLAGARAGCVVCVVVSSLRRAATLCRLLFDLGRFRGSSSLLRAL